METIKPCCREEPDPTEYELRRIRANDPTYNALFNYANNYIKTSKYTFLTFVPLNLFEQFQRLANFYFLCLLVLQLIPQISSLTPITTAVPLIVVLTLTALKDAIDDMQRHRSDSQVNNRRVRVLRGGKLLEERWHKVQVGDIIRMENNQFVAADLLLLSSSEPNGLCYIETAELDGETNLKSRQALVETAELADDHAKMGAFDGEVVCEAPNNHLSRFEGRLSWQGGPERPLDNGQMLLRGCVLRNTRWCYGMVVFAGRDTKLMQNSGRTIFKRTSLDRLLNLLIIGIVFFLLSMCLFCTVACGVWESVTGQHFRPHLPWDPAVVPGNAARGATVIALLVFFSYAIVLNTVVPISLYVSVEVIRFWHSLWINWDERMYDPASDTAARARTTTLNEELGQIEYVFSDKTGTLTRNEMAFARASVRGQAYGELIDDLTHEPLEITEATQRVDFSGNPEHEPAFRFYDGRLLERVQAADPHVHEFFRILALCHTVMPEDKDGHLEYQAQSPDEAALTSAARNFGFVFKSRTPNSITIEVLGKEETYELLSILDFNNVRKRMSVILRKNGQIKLYSKGADSVIFERLAPGGNEVKVKTTDHLNKFASEGLRTLCLASKDLDENVYNSWNERFHQASVALEHREERMNALYEDLEQGLLLVGATAIEDKLQDGVPQAIANLALAGIKIWVLTGDKQETAINIGYSCQLLTDEMSEVLLVDGGTALEVERQLDGHRRQVQSSCAAGDEEGDGHALVINGHSLVYALQPSLERLLVEVCVGCRAVICCRVTPLQKALVVDLVKRYQGAVTLAIGDGANDVSMIKTAHIGVGISGAEGTQAVLASDFAVAQFRHLERLLLVHGRWSYFRMAKFLRYFFYKNFAFTLCHFWFAFFCGFSAQTLYDPFFISFYNVFYTSLPVLALGVFDQDVSERNSLRYPKLYTPGLMNLLFNKMVFLQSVAHGLATSFALFFVAYGAFSLAVDPRGRGLDDLQLFGSAVSTMLVLVVTLQVSLDTAYWTAVNHCVVWGSALFYLGTTLLVSGWSGGGALRAALGSAQLWFALPLAAAVAVAPAAAVRFAQSDCRPTLSDRVRMRQRLRSAPSEPRPLRITRPSRRSIRSGYAFAHQEGFGRLIMSGKIMRKSKSANLHNSLLPPWQRPPSSPSTVDI